MSPLEVLKAARKLIEKGWTQGVYARDAAGDVAAVDSLAACHFCAMGALWRVCGESDPTMLGEAKRLLNSGLTVYGIPSFNDYPGRTQREVLELFDAAIAKAEAAK